MQRLCCKNTRHIWLDIGKRKLDYVALSEGIKNYLFMIIGQEVFTLHVHKCRFTEHSSLLAKICRCKNIDIMLKSYSK